jgi:AcrR family transcriptional regulator
MNCSDRYTIRPRQLRPAKWTVATGGARPIVSAMKRPERRPPGRPRTFDREKALAGATRLFRERGYDGATLAELQRAMGGISPPSLYAAFGSKEELFKESVATYMEATAEAGRCALEDPAISTRDAIERVLRAAVAQSTRSGEPRGCMLVLGALNCAGEDDEPSSVGDHLRKLRVTSYRSIADRIRRGVREGDLATGTDVEGLTTFVTALVNGVSVLARDGASRASLNAAVAHAMRAWDGAAS